jgi:hypothetical protein
MKTETVIGRIHEIFADVGDMRAALRSEGHTPTDIEHATERLVRHHLEPLVPDERFWPQSCFKKCWTCEDTGLVLRYNVRDKHKVLVVVGEPCRCSVGVRFLPKSRNGQDFTQAGKTPKTDFTRAGRR